MLLAIDTATETLSIALHDGDTLAAERTLLAGRRHSALLAPQIERMMAETDLRPADLVALAVAVGPGSYTGARIGVALAKGLASPRGLPLVAATTLETTLAAQALHYDDAPLIATVAAGRNRVIWAEYRAEGESWIERRAPQISDWGAMLARYDCPLRLCGEISEAGLAQIRKAQEAGREIELAPAAARIRRAGYLAEIAWRRLRESGADAFPAADAMPIYLKSA